MAKKKLDEWNRRDLSMPPVFDASNPRTWLDPRPGESYRACALREAREDFVRGLFWIREAARKVWWAGFLTLL